MFVASPTISKPSAVAASPTNFPPPVNTGIVPKLIHPDWSPQTLTNIVKKNPTMFESDDGRWRYEVRKPRYGEGEEPEMSSVGRGLAFPQPDVSHPWPKDRGLQNPSATGK